MDGQAAPAAEASESHESERVEEDSEAEDGAAGQRHAAQRDEGLSFGNMDAADAEALSGDAERAATQRAAALAASVAIDNAMPLDVAIERGMRRPVSAVSFPTESTAVIKIVLPADSPKLLMISLAESACEGCLIRATKGISRVICTGKGAIQTEGINLDAVWELAEDLIAHDKIKINSIWEVFDRYGIEAGRAAIIREIFTVFDSYGIDVDMRHLSLVGDFMTQPGTIRGYNRGALGRHCASILHRASFETSCAALVEGCLSGATETDKPNATAVTFGTTVNTGTGAHSMAVLHDLSCVQLIA
jgi:DNA-directed RNA polymerase I subunit RPA1